MTRRKDPRTARLPVRNGELPAFTPVPRIKERHDGWTPERQRGFIEALADTGSVEAAACAVNMAERGVYDLRRQPGAESFRAAWEAALALGVQRIEDVAMDRALNGVEEPVYSYGKLVGTRRKYNDRLLMFILRNRAPERFAAGGGPRGLNAVSQMQRKRPVETVVGNGQFRDAGGGTGMTGFGWKGEWQLSCRSALQGRTIRVRRAPDSHR